MIIYYMYGSGSQNISGLPTHEQESECHDGAPVFWERLTLGSETSVKKVDPSVLVTNMRVVCGRYESFQNHQPYVRPAELLYAVLS